MNRPPLDRVAVVVPAADEELTIGACLDALHRACAAVPHVDTHVVVVLDRCSDGTADEVARHPGVRTLASSARNVGAARSVGSALAVSRGSEGLWLAHTDADSVVPTDWLVRMLDDAARGADLVLGTVLPGPGLDQEAQALWTASHDPADGHGHVHGANLGIRASAYTALGGFRPLPTGEDVDLVARAVNAGLVISRSGRIAVTTSARRTGRAPDGFAGYLSAAEPG